MRNEHQIISQVYAAKDNMQKADELIRSYIPFIRKEASKFLSGICTEQDDEFSIAMIAFHEAIQNYSKTRGSFLHYASVLIKNRLIDYHRKESRHQGHLSLHEKIDDDGTELHEHLAHEVDHYEESIGLTATKQEVEELSRVMHSFDICLSDVADNSPKQERTMEACRRTVCYAVEHPELLEELLQTKKLPLAKLVAGAKVERKTLERHRKYILAMLLIQTNGYEIIRGHLRHTLIKNGGAST